VYSEVLTGDVDSLLLTLKILHLRVHASSMKLNPKGLLKLVLAQWSGSSNCLGTAISIHCPPPCDGELVIGAGAGCMVVKVVPDEVNGGFTYLVKVNRAELSQG